jgi:hypothetical protein
MGLLLSENVPVRRWGSAEITAHMLSLTFQEFHIGRFSLESLYIEQLYHNLPLSAFDKAVYPGC